MILKRTDIELLRAALKTNGGGVFPELYSQAARVRMLKAGLIQWKPNHTSHHTGYTSLLTITPAGKEALKGLDQ